MVSATLRPLYPSERLGTHCIGTGWASESVWTGAENLAPTGIRSSDEVCRIERIYFDTDGRGVSESWW